MGNDHIIVTCAKCGAKNRVPAPRLGEGPICGKCKARLQPVVYHDKPVEVTDQSFEREVLSYPGTVLLDCWAPWCGPCRLVAPVLDQLAVQYAGRLKVAKLNVDQNPVTASRYAIQSIPTMLIFRNGNQIQRLVGALPKQEIEANLAAALSGDQR